MMKVGDAVTSVHTGAHGRIIRVYLGLHRNGDQSLLVAWSSQDDDILPVLDRVRSSALTLTETPTTARDSE
jgi:hypothetical protein